MSSTSSWQTSCSRSHSALSPSSVSNMWRTRTQCECSLPTRNRRCSFSNIVKQQSTSTTCSPTSTQTSQRPWFSMVIASSCAANTLKPCRLITKPWGFQTSTRLSWKTVLSTKELEQSWFDRRNGMMLKSYSKCAQAIMKLHSPSWVLALPASILRNMKTPRRFSPKPTFWIHRMQTYGDIWRSPC